MPKQTFILNGKTVTVNVNDDVRVLWVLRDLLGVTGPKYGCGINVCKACTSHINGKAFNPCSVRVGDLRPDDEVTTIEGLPDARRRRRPAPDAAGLARPRRRAVRLLPARPDHGRGRAGQEGARARAASITDADLDAIRNICRCGTYTRIREAIEQGARAHVTPWYPLFRTRLQHGGKSGVNGRYSERRGSAPGRPGPASGRRQEDAEGAAAAERGVDVDPAAVARHDPAARSPAPGRCPGWATASGLVERKNSVNEPRLVRPRRDADALVGDREHARSSSSRRRGDDRHRAALRGVLDGVADQVGAARGPARHGRPAPAPGPAAPRRRPAACFRSAATAVRSTASSRPRSPRSTGAVISGLSGSPTFDSSSRSSTTRPSRRAPRSIACSDACAVPGRSGDDSSISRWPSDRGERVLQLVGDGGDQLALVAVELLQLLDQLVLALEGARVEDGAAQVVADVERRGRLRVGPLRDRRRAAGQHQVAQALRAGAERGEEQRADPDLGEERQDRAGPARRVIVGPNGRSGGTTTGALARPRRGGRRTRRSSIIARA